MVLRTVGGPGGLEPRRLTAEVNAPPAPIGQANLGEGVRFVLNITRGHPRGPRCDDERESAVATHAALPERDLRIEVPVHDLTCRFKVPKVRDKAAQLDVEGAGRVDAELLKDALSGRLCLRVERRVFGPAAGVERHV